jgi:hypothetical protein
MLLFTSNYVDAMMIPMFSVSPSLDPDVKVMSSFFQPAGGSQSRVLDIRWHTNSLMGNKRNLMH